MNFKEYLTEANYFYSTMVEIRIYLQNVLGVHYETEIGGDIAAYLILADKRLREQMKGKTLAIDWLEIDRVYADIVKKIKKYTPRDREEARGVYLTVNKKINSSAVRTLEDLIKIKE
jgi:hypothetical protein